MCAYKNLLCSKLTKVNLFFIIIIKEICALMSLASAYVLKAEKQIANGKIDFQSKGGELSLQFEEAFIQLDFLALPLTKKPTLSELIDLLNIQLLNAIWAGDSYLIEVDSKEELLL